MLSLIIFRPLAEKYNLIDYPSNRKDHKGKIPFIGGICIFIGLISSQIYLNQINEIITIILTISFLVLMLGLWDDIVNLRAKTKLVFQLFMVTCTIFLAELKLESLGYLFPLTFPFDLGFFSVGFTALAVVSLINAFNMIDGIDGLAGGVTIIAITGILFYSFHSEINIFNLTLIALLSGLIAFLFFNVLSDNKLKVFLGDSGSTCIGFIISWALIYNCQNIGNFTPSFALWCVSVPVFDFIAVMIVRKYEKRSIMAANRDHIHHVLESFGLSRLIIAAFIILTGFLLLLVGIFFEENYPKLSFPFYLVLLFLYLSLRLIECKNKKNL